MNLTTVHKVELVIVVVGCPSVAVVAMSVGLVLASLVLWAVWGVVVTAYAFDVFRPASAPTAPSPGLPAVDAPVMATDPAQALLAALGDDLTGAQR